MKIFFLIFIMLVSFSCSHSIIQNKELIADQERSPSSIQSGGGSCAELFSAIALDRAKTIRPKIKFMSESEAIKILQAKPLEGTLKIEVGAAHLPMCDDCLQVDRYRSVMDYKISEAKLKGIPADQVKPPKENHIFAVQTRNGVIADARALPFADQSVSIMVTKHLPWANQESPEVREFIRDVLSEYKRVLSDDGYSMILVNGNHDPAALLGAHRDIAIELGFEAIPVRGEEFSGFVLRHIERQ